MTMRHNCETHGCYLKIQTPDWGFLDNSFSGKIRVSDIDGIVEANGNLLILEWKGTGVPVTKGQEIMFNMATRKNNLHVFVINGNAEKSVCEHIKIYANGDIIYNEDCCNEKLGRMCALWETKSRNNSLT